jgi:hypothetical protein
MRGVPRRVQKTADPPRKRLRRDRFVADVIDPVARIGPDRPATADVDGLDSTVGPDEKRGVPEPIENPREVPMGAAIARFARHRAKRFVQGCVDPVRVCSVGRIIRLPETFDVLHRKWILDRLADGGNEFRDTRRA